MKLKLFALTAIAASALVACGGGGGGSSSVPTSQGTVTAPLMLSDASSQDWSNIGVVVTSVTFTSASGSTANLLSAPYTGNLENLDNVAEYLNAAALVPGTTYTGAVITLSANPGDVTLTVSGDPEAGFVESPNTVVPSSRIQVQGASGNTGSKTVTVPITFNAPYTAPQPSSGTTTNPTTATGINIEFDLSNPAFLVAHTPAGANPTTIWAVNFAGGIKHKSHDALTHLVLRHAYGQVASVSTDNTTLTITKVTPTAPAALNGPETATATAISMPITVDATNGTLFYDLDDTTKNATIHDLSTVASILANGEYVRVAARYQQNGTLVATRIYASSTFNKVYVSPEGHVLHVNGGAGTLTIDSASGTPVAVNVSGTTNFFFRSPATGSDVTPIATGTAGLALIQRGFKVRVTPVDATATPLVAATIDIESAPFEGWVSSASSTGFTLARNFNITSDNYTQALNYISSSTVNGVDPTTGNAITGFKYWNFAYPSIVDSGVNAVSDFVTAVGASSGAAVTLGVTSYPAKVLSYSIWNNASSSYLAPQAILIPTQLPATKVAAAPVGSATSFAVVPSSGTAGTPLTVRFSTTLGSATLVHNVDRSGSGIVTVSPVDITTANGLNALTSALTVGSRVVIYGLPQADGSIKAYQIRYYTGTAPL